MQWLPVLAAAFVFVVLSAGYLVLMPMSGAQFVMVFCCLFLSVVLADVAVLRRQLVRLMGRLRREEAVLGRASLRASRS